MKFWKISVPAVVYWRVLQNIGIKLTKLLGVHLFSRTHEYSVGVLSSWMHGFNHVQGGPLYVVKFI